MTCGETNLIRTQDVGNIWVGGVERGGEKGCSSLQRRRQHHHLQAETSHLFVLGCRTLPQLGLQQDLNYEPKNQKLKKCCR